jgi:Delta7-sterol 5-desaturase
MTMESQLSDLYTWPFDSASIIIRYFLLAGSGYFIFYIWKRDTFSGEKIQKKIPSNKIIRIEILYSVFTLIIYCTTSAIVFRCYELGNTKIYFDIAKYGYSYFVLSIFVMLIVHDAYFYWTHRFMHLPKIFKIVHRSHHLSTNPTPWAAFSFHPLEAIISIGIIPINVFIIPSHPFALFSFLTIMTLINVMGHLGYELFSQKMINHKIGKWQNTSTNHNIHHRHSKYNFGLYFTFWDRMMKTYSAKPSNN